MTHLGVVERNLATESAADLLAEIEAGTRSRCLLPWLAGGDDPTLIDRWKAAAEAEPDTRRRAEFRGLALVFAEKAGCDMVWEQKLAGWNVEESKVVNRWIAEAEARVLLRLGAQRFGVPPENTETVIRAIKDPARMERMLDRVRTATDWADLLATP